MEDINNQKREERNFNTISPSARSLLLMKGHTDIPFARQAAELIIKPEKFVPDFNRIDKTFWARVLHFESRYKSINQLLEDVSSSNILELSSGFSFRCLEKITGTLCHYIDTDLPELVAGKKTIAGEIIKNVEHVKGTLEMLSLNALNESDFKEIISRFPEGEITIINEGLLMYLDAKEKEILCGIIHKILKERGGRWITADIYLKNKTEKLDLKIDDNTKQFFEMHNIEGNKFNSFEEAESFFKRNGFVIEKAAHINSAELSALKYLRKSASMFELIKMSKAGRMQASWRLKPI